MNFTSLVVHGLSALSVFSHIIGVRLLIASAILMLVALAGLIVGSFADGGDPPPAAASWLPAISAWLLATLVQAVLLGVAFVLLVLSSRHGTTFIPKRDYRYFVASLKPFTPRS